MLSVTFALGYSPTVRMVSVPRAAVRMVDATAEGFGASHTSMYTDAVAKDKYDTLEDLLATKMANDDLRSVINTMFDGCGTITEALRKELVTVAEKQESVFGDVQLGVDVLADELMWDICKTDPLIKEGASEEEPEVREMHADGKFSICWDPLDGSSIGAPAHSQPAHAARARARARARTRPASKILRCLTSLRIHPRPY